MAGGGALWTTAAAAPDAPPAQPDRVIRSLVLRPRPEEFSLPDHAGRGERGAPAGPPSVVPGESRPTHRRGHTHLQGINTRVARASLLCRMET
ncbi:MAG: hypothetical protein ACRDTE_08275 [Pseudonocardiaceae bacterium]